MPAPPAARRLPRRRTSADPPLWWLGAHGGAGETTLAALLPGSLPSGHAWPQTPGATRVALVARSNANGLTAAQHAATDWASGGAPNVELLGLVIVADAPGKLPRALKELAAHVSGGVPRVWRLPWIEAWRVGEHPDPRSSPRPVARLLSDIGALLPPAPPAVRDGR